MWLAVSCSLHGLSDAITAMSAFLLSNYDLWRGLHIIGAIAWVAGLLILPRIFIYHLRASAHEAMAGFFQQAEVRTLQIILNPAMVWTWGFWAVLVYVDLTSRGWAFLGQPWVLTKFAGIGVMTAWHGYLIIATDRFARGTNARSERFWRLANELPFLAAIVMVLAVTTEFGQH